MIINGIKMDDFLKSVAAQLGASPSDIQADFLNTFFDELRKNCKTHYNAEVQMHYIAADLSDSSKELAACWALPEPPV